MSFSNKKNRPDSKDTAKLRAEYEAKVRVFRDADPKAGQAKAKDEKQKAFQRVVEQMSGERREALAAEHKVLIRMGKMKTKEQVAAEQEKIQEKRKRALEHEERETIVV